MFMDFQNWQWGYNEGQSFVNSGMQLLGTECNTECTTVDLTFNKNASQ